MNYGIATIVRFSTAFRAEGLNIDCEDRHILTKLRVGEVA